MISTRSENHELQLANEFVEHTGSHIFLTGKAGTGKTTFLHKLKDKTAKRMVITAPTGVAAINAGGVTLHSFFQLPFGPFIPFSKPYENSRRRIFRFSKEKKEIIKSLDLLVIDEVSMVRADLLDSVDEVLRRHRGNDQPFGGVQLLMIGDLLQLSPVAKEEEWQLLQRYYESVYFFSSHALGRTELFTIELNHIYRQSDLQFIKLLNQVRDNRLDPASVSKLNQRYINNFIPEEDQGYITLTTHNNSADFINRERLFALAGEEYCFNAEISGDFPEHLYPTPARLMFKVGAQVMFLRNDTAAVKRYYNGKVGKIKRLSSQQITIICPENAEEIVVEPAEWANIRYTMDKENSQIQEETIGRFRQFPLKLAWSITIHKSQGLTFDKAIIDASAAFAHGQVYVALSRCKTFEGMVLSSPVPPHGIEADKALLSFIKTCGQNPLSEKRLQEARVIYQQKLLLDCFDFQLLHNRLNYFIRLLLGNANRVQLYGFTDIGRLQEIVRSDIFTVSEKFKQQLRTIFADRVLPESDPYTAERIGKASIWFQERFSSVFDDLVLKLQVESENNELNRKIVTCLNSLKHEITVKLAGIRSCEDGFSPSWYLRSISKAKIDSDPEREKSEEKRSSEKRTADSETKHVTFDMFNRGLTITRIAEERSLVESTIIGHLCFFIEIGRLNINRVISPEKQKRIEAAIAQTCGNSLKTVKEVLGESFSYQEIKLVVAHQKHLASKLE